MAEVAKIHENLGLEATAQRRGLGYSRLGEN
jgi:hypothetical protein